MSDAFVLQQQPSLIGIMQNYCKNEITFRVNVSLIMFHFVIGPEIRLNKDSRNGGFASLAFDFDISYTTGHDLRVLFAEAWSIY